MDEKRVIECFKNSKNFEQRETEVKFTQKFDPAMSFKKFLRKIRKIKLFACYFRSCKRINNWFVYSYNQQTWNMFAYNSFNIYSKVIIGSRTEIIKFLH